MAVVFIAVAALTAADGYAPAVEPDPNLDALMLELSLRSGRSLPARYYQRPLDYRDIAAFFAGVIADSTIRISEEERCRIVSALKRNGFEDALYHWQSDHDDVHIKVNVHLLGDVKPSVSDSAQLRLSGIVAPSFAGNLGRLSFYSGISVWTEYRSDTLFGFPSYEPYDGIAYNLYGRSTEHSHARSSDLPHGGISYDAGRIRLDAAIDYLRNGPARYFPLTLSGTAPPMTFLRASYDLSVVNYTHVAALLKDQKDKRKFLFMHRLEGDAWKRRIHFGLNEVIVYGSTTDEPLSVHDSVLDVYRQESRSVEPEYLIPFLPFKFVEHYSGDRDNAAVSADVALYWPKTWTLYGEFFLDDMLSPWKLFTNDWGNKWALTVGCSHAGTWREKPLSVNAEFSRVEPWVYTHFGGGSHRYSHFDKCLGSPLGPNSLGAGISSLLQISPLHEIGFGFNLTVQDTAVRGGKITDVFQHPDPEDPLRYFDSNVKTFLGSDADWHLEPAIYWNFNSFGVFTVNAMLSVDLLENAGSVHASFYGGLYF